MTSTLRQIASSGSPRPHRQIVRFLFLDELGDALVLDLLYLGLAGFAASVAAVGVQQAVRLTEAAIVINSPCLQLTLW
jgi:hypothetical protein